MVKKLLKNRVIASWGITCSICIVFAVCIQTPNVFGHTLISENMLTLCNIYIQTPPDLIENQKKKHSQSSDKNMSTWI